MLSWAEERDLVERAQDGDQDAVSRLVMAFEPLVRSCAAKYRRYGFSLDDLSQSATIGLIKAIRRLDPAKGRLSTYARWWIRSELNDFVRGNFAAVRIPKGERIVASRSLNEPAWDDGNSVEKEELLEQDDGGQEDVLGEIATVAHLRERAEEIADTVLTAREREIFIARHLSDDRSTLDALGKRFGVSRERIRQVESVALEKVRKAAETRAPTIRKRQKNLVQEMAEFYSETMPRHMNLDDWADAAKKRFPQATADDRRAAHRLADKLREDVR